MVRASAAQSTARVAREPADRYQPAAPQHPGPHPGQERHARDGTHRRLLHMARASAARSTDAVAREPAGPVPLPAPLQPPAPHDPTQAKTHLETARTSDAAHGASQRSRAWPGSPEARRTGTPAGPLQPPAPPNPTQANTHRETARTSACYTWREPAQHEARPGSPRARRTGTPAGPLQPPAPPTPPRPRRTSRRPAQATATHGASQRSRAWPGSPEARRTGAPAGPLQPPAPPDPTQAKHAPSDGTHKHMLHMARASAAQSTDGQPASPPDRYPRRPAAAASTPQPHPGQDAPRDGPHKRCCIWREPAQHDARPGSPAQPAGPVPPPARCSRQHPRPHPGQDAPRDGPHKHCYTWREPAQPRLARKPASPPDRYPRWPAVARQYPNTYLDRAT